jgi:hypothetical protein
MYDLLILHPASEQDKNCLYTKIRQTGERKSSTWIACQRRNIPFIRVLIQYLVVSCFSYQPSWTIYTVLEEYARGEKWVSTVSESIRIISCLWKISMYSISHLRWPYIQLFLEDMMKSNNCIHMSEFYHLIRCRKSITHWFSSLAINHECILA